MKKRVLIVDDNENNLLLEKDLFELAGYEVIEAENATAGIAAARRERPDLIIMDARLPDMRGSEAARIIREDDDLKGILIVFVTASVMSEEKTSLIAFANSGFISKPINTRTFVIDATRFLK